MPFESKSQQRFMFAKHPEMAKEWADKTPDISALPEHVKKMADGGTPEEGNWEHNPDAPSLPEVGQGMKEGINHDSDAVKSYLSSKFAQLLHPNMGEDTTQSTSTIPPSAIGQTPTQTPSNMAEGGYPHVTFMEDQTPEENAKTTHLEKEPTKMAEGGTTPHFLEGLKKGALHKEMGISEDKKIPEKKLEHAANSDNETLRKRAQFAINAKKWHHADGGIIEKVEGRDKEPAKPKDVDMSHEKKLNSIYKAMGIKKYADGGDVDVSQLPSGGISTPSPSDPTFWDQIKAALAQTGNSVGNALGKTIPTMPTIAEGAANVAATPGIAPAINQALGTNIPDSTTPATTPIPPAPAASPTLPPAARAPIALPTAAPNVPTPSNTPNLNTLFNQDTSKLTAGVNPEDRQAVIDQLRSRQEGLGGIIAQAVAGLGDAFAAKGGREQHSLQNIFSMQKDQRNEALANFDKARQDRVQKLALQTQMGQNAIQQLAAQDAYGTDEHLNKMLGAPAGTAHKDLPLYFQMKSAQVAQQEKDADLYMKAHAQAAADVDNAVKNSSILSIKPSEAQLQASGAKLADQYFNRAKGNVLVKPSDGGLAQWIPAQNLGKAKQMDPNLQVQP